MLLRQADRQFGPIREAAGCIPDPQRQASVQHSVAQMIGQRIFAIACGEGISRINVLGLD